MHEEGWKTEKRVTQRKKRIYILKQSISAEEEGFLGRGILGAPFEYKSDSGDHP